MISMFIAFIFAGAIAAWWGTAAPDHLRRDLFRASAACFLAGITGTIAIAVTGGAR